jgi:hypothetical protein
VNLRLIIEQVRTLGPGPDVNLRQVLGAPRLAGRTAAVWSDSDSVVVADDECGGDSVRDRFGDETWVPRVESTEHWPWTSTLIDAITHVRSAFASLSVTTSTAAQAAL